MEFLIIAALIGVIPASVAAKKGRSFGLWWLYGVALFIVALPHSLMLNSTKESAENQQSAQRIKQCPDCAEDIKLAARVCHYCGHQFNTAEVEAQVAAQEERLRKRQEASRKQRREEADKQLGLAAIIIGVTILAAIVFVAITLFSV